ncbi:MAG TPA: hypothetical protein PLI62_10325 [Spirochaetota bacterium]|nr:hypothetical protein [Spirochaetota bacterium]
MSVNTDNPKQRNHIIMAQENEEKKIERKAKAMLLSKDIPPSKMEIVRSLMQNNSLLPEEKYRAIIELIQSCRDKPRSTPRSSNIELRTPQKKPRTPPPASPAVPQEPVFEPSTSGVYIDDINRKYKKLKFFKKRYLIHSDNRFGFGLQKRLIPTKRFMKCMQEIIKFQESLLSKYPDILVDILRDENIIDAANFNYLVAMKNVLSGVPLSKYTMDIIKWMDRKDFDVAFRDFVQHFFSFYLLDAETKEQIILLVEQKLRNHGDFKKDIINEKDSPASKNEKEKRNLSKEKEIFNYTYIMRSFLSAGQESDNAVAKFLNANYGIGSFPRFLIILLEALVFHRELSLKDVTSYYHISPPSVSNERWNYSPDMLKKYGKDEDSRRRRKIQLLKDSLQPYEDLYTFMKYELKGRNILEKNFEDHWRLIDKKRQDPAEIYQDDFFTFIDGCVNYFAHCYMHILDGSLITFLDKNREPVEAHIFTAQYFEKEKDALEDILSEIYHFRSNNPNMVISLQEAQKVLKGLIKSMSHIEGFFKRIGSLFYQFAERMSNVYDLHRKWVLSGSPLQNNTTIRVPLNGTNHDSGDESEGSPIPFSDCSIKEFQHTSPLLKTLAGMPVVTPDLNEGLIIHIIAFCYQLSFECQDESLIHDLQERKNILTQIKELVG